MITTAIVWDHRKRVKRGDEGPLEIRVTIHRKPYYINTGIRVCARNWQFDKIVNHPLADVLNERLGIILDQVMRDINNCIKHGRTPDVTQLRKRAWGAVSKADFMEWCQDEIELLGVAHGTYKHYRSLLNRLREYRGMLDWADINVENIYKWDAWLRNLPGRTAKMSCGGVYNYHKCLSSLLGRAERSGLLNRNPYHLLRGEFSKGERESIEYLTEDEMRRIQSIKPAQGSWMERVRDLFIFQMFTGLSYSDAQAFDISAYRLVDGKWRIVGSRIKTGQPFVNQLLPPAVEVLERYGMKVPKIENHVYNRELKTLGLACGITIPMHSHLARHTFATFMLRNGVKVENLAKMMGHSNIRQTMRYAKVLAESVHEDFDMIEAKILKKSGS